MRSSSSSRASSASARPVNTRWWVWPGIDPMPVGPGAKLSGLPTNTLSETWLGNGCQPMTRDTTLCQLDRLFVETTA